jgi:diadenosine tetraphosphatase ApaH/serine/threonine PP2A family protein phosphatase
VIETSFLQGLIQYPEKITNLRIDKVTEILIDAKNILEEDNLLLEFDMGGTEEVYVIGDIHGNLVSLLKLYEILIDKKPGKVIFLGDIVDRGPKQIECLVFILALKILEPNKFYILKGNHETLEMNQAYGFFYEFSQRFESFDRYKEILAVYNVIPICAIINNEILCLHGGIPEDFNIIEKLKGLNAKDLDNSLLKSLEVSIFQIMWNDPKSGLSGFMDSYRGMGIKFFGEDIFEEFMKKNKLKYLIRAHECFPEGYVWFFSKRLLSIFSSANYRGNSFPNPASYAIIRDKTIIPVNIDLL